MAASYDVENTPNHILTPDDDKGLTDWDNEPTILDLKQDLEDANSAHKAHTTEVKTWLDNLKIEGNAVIKKRTGRSNIVPKLIRKQAEWRYAALSEPFLSTDDIYNTDPVTFEDKDAAIQNGLVLNNQFNTKIQKVKFIDDYIRTAVDEGTVCVRVGWEYEDETNEVEVPNYIYQVSQDPAIQQQFQQLHQAMTYDPSVFDKLSEAEQELHRASMDAGAALEQIIDGYSLEEEVTVLKNHPTVEVCDYNNLIIDPSCQGDLKKARFAIYSFETSLSELEKDGKYHNLDKINVEGTSILNEPDHESRDESSFNFKDKPRKKFVAYEYWGYWDINKSGVVKPIVATWVGGVLIRMEENPFPDQEIPFVTAQYLPIRGSIYGEPDGALLEDNQRIVGAVTRGMIDIMGRSANGQVGTRKDALDVTNKRKFDNGLDYEFNSQVDPKQAIFMHTYPEIPRSAEYMLNLQNSEAESLSGVRAFANGIGGQALGDTATEVRSALDAVSKRELGILRRLAQGFKDIGRKIISMNAEFLSDVEVIRITNDEFVEVRRDDLAGNFDITLTISTAESDNQKAQELAFMLQTMGNNMDFGMSKIILTDIARLRNMPTLAKRIEEFEPQPDPLAQKKAELEVELLGAQVANETAKAEENAMDIRLKRAKAQTEEAKARNLHSKSDSQDLDFLDKESGADHERKLDEKDHDRATQLDMKTAEALLAEDKEGTGQTAQGGVELPDITTV